VRAHNCETMSTEGSKEINRNRLPRRSRWVRRLLGAGAYPFLSRWIDPNRQYSQIVYAELLSKLVQGGAAWLDAGCGHQVFKISSTHQEAQIVARSKIAVGCDLDYHGLQAHRSFKLRASCDLRRLPFASEAFDIVTLNYVAEHLEEPEATFEELTRVLRPGGTLVVVTPHAPGYFVRLSRLGRILLPESLMRRFILLREFRSPEDIFPTFYRANTRDDLLRQMKEAGLTEECFQMLRDPAIFNFIAPLAALELVAGRMLALLGFRKLVEGTMIGVYYRSPRRVTCSGHRERTSEPGRPVTVN
jgi:ubiquinone/menaquinone biosynthesis C-methylase UbiE